MVIWMIKDEKDEEVITNIIWVLSIITSINEIEIDIISIIEIVVAYIESENQNIKVFAIRAIGNICTENEEIVNMVIKEGGLNSIARLINAEKQNLILFELCWAISNIALGPSSHIDMLLGMKIINKLIEIILTCNDIKVNYEYIIGA